MAVLDNMDDRCTIILLSIALVAVLVAVLFPLIPTFGVDRVISTATFNCIAISLLPILWQLKRRISLQSPWRRALFQISIFILVFVIVSCLAVLLNPLIGPSPAW